MNNTGIYYECPHIDCQDNKRCECHLAQGALNCLVYRAEHKKIGDAGRKFNKKYPPKPICIVPVIREEK